MTASLGLGEAKEGKVSFRISEVALSSHFGNRLEYLRSLIGGALA